jgi:hypothetical protein
MSSLVMCAEDFLRLVLIPEIRKMSEQEKFEFRCGIRKAFKMAKPKVGDTVTVELFRGHKVRGVVKAIYDTTEGKKFQISAGDISVKVEEGQIVSE